MQAASLPCRMSLCGPHCSDRELSRRTARSCSHQPEPGDTGVKHHCLTLQSPPFPCHNTVFLSFQRNISLEVTAVGERHHSLQKTERLLSCIPGGLPHQHLVSGLGRLHVGLQLRWGSMGQGCGDLGSSQLQPQLRQPHHCSSQGKGNFQTQPAVPKENQTAKAQQRLQTGDPGLHCPHELLTAATVKGWSI